MYRLPRDIDEDPASLPKHGRANHLGACEYRLDDRSMYAQQVSPAFSTNQMSYQTNQINQIKSNQI
jgi:hypothetical protein